MNLREVRKKFGLTQKEVCNAIHMPLRTYIRYENDPKYESTYKYQRTINDIIAAFEVTEERGVLTLKQIKDIVTEVLDTYEVEYCYLFGSYAKGYASERSDVDLCIDTDTDGFAFYGLVEKLRVALHKEVDLIRVQGLNNNITLLREIMKDGIRIYDKHQR